MKTAALPAIGFRLQRRRVGLAALSAAALLLGGCGLRLRGATALPFSRMAITGAPASSPIGQELRRQFGGRVQIVETASRAEVVLHVESAQREKTVSGLTATGLVRELVLRLRFRFRIGASDGSTLIDSTELVLQRDMATNETAALAKAREEDEIFRVLERDAVLQLARRLEALKLPTVAVRGS